MNRPEQKRRDKEYRRKVERHGLDSTRLDGYEIIALMRILREKVASSIALRSVAPLMDYLYANMAAGAKHLANVPVACARGCSHCCHDWVDATPPEAIYVIKQMDAGRRAQVLEAVESVCERTAGRSITERGKMAVPCPLLSDNRCSVYSNRPNTCRTLTSIDMSICRRSYLQFSGEDVPTPAVWMYLRQGYSVALDGAISHAGLVPLAREWNESLRVALTVPDAERRWLEGADDFAQVPLAGNPAIYENATWRAIYQEAFGTAPR